MKLFSFQTGLAVLLASLFASSIVQADIVASGSQPFTEPSSFYSGVKSVTVYTHDDPGNPFPGAAGELTYVYTISNDIGSILGINGFNLDAPVDSVIAAGSIPDADPTTPPPSAVINNNDGVVRWDWAVATGLIAPGTTSEELYIVSAHTPGSLSDTIYSLEGEFSFDLQSTCIGPLDPPAEECDLEIVKEGCVVQPPSPPGDECEGKVKKFKFEYTGLGCDASSHLQDPKKTMCTGGANGDDPVDIIFYGGKHKKKKHGWWGSWNKHKRKKTFASFKDVHVGDMFYVDAGHGGKKNLGSSTRVKIKTKNGWHYNVIEYGKFHTSCSQPLGPGHQFGSIKIVELTSTQGGTVTLEEDPPSEECVTEIDVIEPPHCQGKIEKLTLRYTGGDCSQTMHSQDAGKVGCVDINPAGTDPVRVIVSETASASSDPYIDAEPIEIGDTFVVDAAGAGNSELKSTTGFWIKDALSNELIMDGFFHTSCSQPLNLGDQIGSFQVFGLETTQGGTVSLGHQVDYTYAVTNPNTGDATNVSVDDDLLGNIASGESVGAGMTSIFTASSFVSEETTNVATVTGEVDGVTCNESSDSVTITVTEPEPIQICTSKIEAMRVRYTGPDTYGARVEIEAKTFPSELVVYDPIDLISGVTELALASEGGWSIDASSHGETDLGSKVIIRINGCDEEIHTSCSTPFEAGKPAPLNDPKGDPSPNWTVINFTQKN